MVFDPGAIVADGDSLRIPILAFALVLPPTRFITLAGGHITFFDRRARPRVSCGKTSNQANLRQHWLSAGRADSRE